MVQPWQLSLLFDSDSFSIDINSRMRNIREAILIDELITVDKFSHPDIVRLLSLWKEYLISTEEDHKAYDLLKAKFIEIFGRTWFDQWLQFTYYFHRSKWMEIRKLKDTNEREIA